MTRIAMTLAGLGTIGTTLWALNTGGGAPSVPDAAAGATAATGMSAIAAPGRVEPVSEEIDVGSEIVGRLARVNVDEGDRVRAGDVLAEIDNADFRARVASAAARLASAEAEHARVVNGARGEQRREAEAQRRQAEAAWQQAETEHGRRASLFASGAIAQEEAERAARDARLARARLDEAAERAQLVSAEARDEDRAQSAAAVSLARAALEEARAMLAKTAIRAPQDLTIIRRLSLTGELVSPESGPLFTLADTSRLRVRAEVDETDVGRLAAGQPASLRADAYGERRFSGRVSRIGLALGRKQLRTDRPTEKLDTSVLETLIDLDPGVALPIGLRVDVFIEPR
jgi:HlyD family secretion protein